MFRTWLHRPVIALLERITMNQAEFNAKLEAAAARAEKVKAEVIAAIGEIRNTDTTPEQDAALARLETAIGGIDDLNADAVEQA